MKTLILKIAAIINHNRRSKVIFYHDISGAEGYTDMGTPFTLFVKHIDLIKQEGFELVREINQPYNQIQICFDDGFKGIYDHRVYFSDNNIKPTVFLAVSLIGNKGYLSEKEILELQDEGYRFQSHTVSHRDLTKLNDKDLAYELEHSKIFLESLLKNPVDEFCFPIGFFSKHVIKACLNANYKKLYSSLPGNYYNNPANPIIYRNLVQFLIPTELKATLYGGMSLLRCWYKRVHYL